MGERPQGQNRRHRSLQDRARGAARRRIGVNTNHAAQATIAAISAPREYESTSTASRDRERRDAQRPEDPPAGGARAGPDARRHTESGYQAGGVPITERSPQPAHHVIRIKRCRKHLDKQRVATDHRRRRGDRAEQRRPALRDDPCHRERRSERCQVTERPVGLGPRIVGLHRPGDRYVRQRRQRREQQQGYPAPRAARGTEHRDRDGECSDDQRERDLDPGIGTQIGASGRQEGDQHEAGGEDGSEHRVAGYSRQAQASGAFRIAGVRRSVPRRRGH